MDATAFSDIMERARYAPAQVHPVVNEGLEVIMFALRDMRLSYLGVLYFHVWRYTILIQELELDDEEQQLGFFSYVVYVMITNDARCTPDVHFAFLRFSAYTPYISYDTNTGYVSEFYTYYFDVDDELDNRENARQYLEDFIEQVRASRNPIVEYIQCIADVSDVITDEDFINPEDKDTYIDRICDAFESNHRISHYINIIRESLSDIIN